MKLTLLLFVTLVFLAILVGPEQTAQEEQTTTADPIEAADANDSTYETETTEEIDYSLHAESGERLTTIMQRLSMVMGENSNQIAVFDEDQLADMTEAVEELLFFAELMSIKVPVTELEENETVIFSAIANQLYDEALNVKQIAENYQIQPTYTDQDRLLNSALERMGRTCNACHQLFRDY